MKKSDAPQGHKRKYRSESESETESVAKAAKLIENEQATLEHIQTELKKCRQPKPSAGQGQSKESMVGMLSELKSKLSPSKENNSEEGLNSSTGEAKEHPESLSAKIDNLNGLMSQMIKIQLDQGKKLNEFDSGLTTVKTDVKAVSDRVKVLEDKMLKGQVSQVLSQEDRHESYLQNQIDHSRKCVTLLGTGRDTLSIKDAEHLLKTNKMASEGEIEVTSINRLGNPRGTNPAFKVELKTEEMATSLIVNSKVQNGKGESSIRCATHFPVDYATRAREMKSMQSVAWKAGLHSQIYFKGTELALKVKEVDSKRWMDFPSEFGTYKPEKVMQATASSEDTAEMKATRDSILEKLNMSTSNGKHIVCEKKARSLVYSSKGGNLAGEELLKNLPEAKKEEIEALEVVRSNSTREDEYQTRLVFKSRDEAKATLAECIRAFKTNPLPKGDFLELELLWAS